MASIGFDPAVLPDIVERKGTLFLRSDHMKYGRSTLNSNWHSDREAEPKDYDVSAPPDGKRNLLKATYNRIGNITDGSFPETTLQEAMTEGQLLKNDYKEKHTHKTMIAYDNFLSATNERECKDVLPRHQPEYNKRHLNTTQKSDYQYPFEWSPTTKTDTPTDDTYIHHRGISEFTDTDDHRKKGLNIWQDY